MIKCSFFSNNLFALPHPAFNIEAIIGNPELYAFAGSGMWKLFILNDNATNTLFNRKTDYKRYDKVTSTTFENKLLVTYKF